MRRERFVITDRSWSRIEPLSPGTTRSRGVTAKDNQLFFEAVLWKVRVGAPWRDLPPGFGRWNSVFHRFRRWAESGVFERIFEAVSGEPDFEYALIDGAMVNVHQKASGAKGGTRNQAIGRSKGGLTTKVLALVDALGNLVRFELLPGQRSEIVAAPGLIEGLRFDALLADKAFDADHFRKRLDAMGAGVVIPAKRNRIHPIPHDEAVYAWRHLIENDFSKIKAFRGVNTRYDKTDVSYRATWAIAATLIALR